MNSSWLTHRSAEDSQNGRRLHKEALARVPRAQSIPDELARPDAPKTVGDIENSGLLVSDEGTVAYTVSPASLARKPTDFGGTGPAAAASASDEGDWQRHHHASCFEGTCLDHCLDELESMETFGGGVVEVELCAVREKPKTALEL